MITKTKSCTKCGVEKPYDAFGKDKVKPLGLKPECRDCKRKYNLSFYKGNKRWFKDYFHENRAAYTEAKNRYREPDSIPTHLVGCSQERKRLKDIYSLARKMTVTSGVKYHVDHMWPLSGGGPHWSGNLQIMLAGDNIRKRSSVCEDTKRTIQESLAWEIQRHNNTKSTTKHK